MNDLYIEKRKTKRPQTKTSAITDLTIYLNCTKKMARDLLVKHGEIVPAHEINAPSHINGGLVTYYKCNTEALERIREKAIESDLVSFESLTKRLQNKLIKEYQAGWSENHEGDDLDRREVFSILKDFGILKDGTIIQEG